MFKFLLPLLICISLSYAKSNALLRASHVVNVRVINVETRTDKLIPYTNVHCIVDEIYKSIDNSIDDTICILQRGVHNNSGIVTGREFEFFVPYSVNDSKILSLVKIKKKFRLINPAVQYSIASLNGGTVNSYSQEGIESSDLSIKQQNEMLKEINPLNQATETYINEIKEEINRMPHNLFNEASVVTVVKITSIQKSQDETVLNFKHIRTIKGQWNILEKSIILPPEDVLATTGIFIPAEAQRVVLFFDKNNNLMNSAPFYFAINKDNTFNFNGKTYNLDSLVKGE